MKEKTVSPQRGHLISVIVPVYKVEPYLRCCIDSILAQTFTDFELILVDDGSPDNCGAICDEYAAKDDRIIVIHQQNGGLSAARNAGIDWVFANSDSQWITFVDSDDYIMPVYLEWLLRYALENEAEIAMTNLAFVNDDSALLNECSSNISVQSLSGREVCKSFYHSARDVLPSAWGKLYKKEIWSECRFTVGKINEDEDLIPRILYDMEHIVAIRAWLYCYRQRPESITRTYISPKRFEHMDAFDTCIQFYKMHGDREVAQLAEYSKNLHWADYIIQAQQNNIYHTLPKQYKLPVWKAYWILLADTIRRGGIKFVFVRIGNMFKRFSRK